MLSQKELSQFEFFPLFYYGFLLKILNIAKKLSRLQFSGFIFVVMSRMQKQAFILQQQVIRAFLWSLKSMLLFYADAVWLWQLRNVSELRSYWKEWTSGGKEEIASIKSEKLEEHRDRYSYNYKRSQNARAKTSFQTIVLPIEIDDSSQDNSMFWHLV